MSYCKIHKQKHDTTHCPICEGERMGEAIVEKRWALTKIFTCIERNEKFQGSPEVSLSHSQCLNRIFYNSVGCNIDCEKAKEMFTNDDHYNTSNGFNMDFVKEVLYPNGYSLETDPQLKETNNMAKKTSAKKDTKKNAATSAKKDTKKNTKKNAATSAKKDTKKNAATSAKKDTKKNAAVKDTKKAATTPKVTKQQMVRDAFAKKTTQSVDELLAIVGGSENNLRVSMGILKNPSRTKNMLVTTYDKANKTFTAVKS